MARRYFARILVARSTSMMSMRRRMRASRSVPPISVTRGRLFEAGVRPRLAPPAGLRERGHDARHVLLGDEHLPRLRALVAGDHAPPFEHVDEPPGTGVAEAQPPLEHGGGRGAHLRHEGDRLVEQRVLVRVVAVLVGAARLVLVLVRDLLEQLLVEVWLALAAPELGDLGDLR